MRRTTSLASMPSVPKQVRQGSGGGGGDKDKPARARPSSSVSAGAVGTGGGGYPSPGRDAFAGLMITAAFLSACGFCAKPLGPGEDTYIYRYRRRPCFPTLCSEMSGEILVFRPWVPFLSLFGGLLAIFGQAPINLSCCFAVRIPRRSLVFHVRVALHLDRIFLSCCRQPTILRTCLLRCEIP